MPFNEENLLKKIGKWFGKQYRLSSEAEEKVAKKFGVVPMPEIGGAGKVVPKVAKTAWQFLPRQQVPGKILEVLKKGEKLTEGEITHKIFATGYRATMEEIWKGIVKLKKVGKLGQTKEISRPIKRLEGMGKALGVRFTETIKEARFFKK